MNDGSPIFLSESVGPPVCPGFPGIIRADSSRAELKGHRSSRFAPAFPDYSELIQAPARKCHAFAGFLQSVYPQGYCPYIITKSHRGGTEAVLLISCRSLIYAGIACPDIPNLRRLHLYLAISRIACIFSNATGILSSPPLPPTVSFVTAPCRIYSPLFTSTLRSCVTEKST